MYGNDPYAYSPPSAGYSRSGGMMSSPYGYGALWLPFWQLSRLSLIQVTAAGTADEVTEVMEVMEGAWVWVCP